MNISLNLMRTCLFSALLSFTCFSHAAITLGGTRLIFTAPNKEASILAKNNADQDVMIQSWIDPDEHSTDSDTPFAITPSLSRLGANKQQLLRIFYQGKGASTDKESAYWLSVQEIPPKSNDENILQIAVRQKIKVFYRPENLPGSAVEAPQQLQWKVTSKGLEVKNPTAFHVSLAKVKLVKGNIKYSVDADMVRPGETNTFSITGWNAPSSGTVTVEFESINDYGGVDEFTAVTK
jgi:chaperone protein EcpD